MKLKPYGYEVCDVYKAKTICIPRKQSQLVAASQMGNADPTSSNIDFDKSGNNPQLYILVSKN